VILLDTHVAIWLRSEPERLSSAATAAIRAADEVAVSDTTFWEIAMLTRKGRLGPEPSLAERLHVLATTTTALPIGPGVATALGLLPDDFPAKDPADQIIYATARAHEVPLVSADERLRSHDPEVIWS